MSVIVINCGQCGNQIGFELLNSLWDHSGPGDIRGCLDLFYRKSSKSDKTYARAVCLDMEPKVINTCVQHALRDNKWLYDPKSVAYRHGGAGLVLKVLLCITFNN